MYLLGDTIAEHNKWDDVESVAFYAIEPGRDSDHEITVDAQTQPDGRIRLSIDAPVSEAKPLFVALPPTGQTAANPSIVPLYEYRHADSGRFRYSTQPELKESGWSREEKPLCRVWKTPASPLLLDREARPADAL